MPKCLFQFPFFGLGSGLLGVTLGVVIGWYSMFAPAWTGANQLFVFAHQLWSELFWLDARRLLVGGSVVGIVVLRTLMLVW